MALIKYHYIDKCRNTGHWSELVEDPREVTCKVCIEKYNITQKSVKAFLVKRNGYMNVLEPKYIIAGEDVFARFIVDTSILNGI